MIRLKSGLTVLGLLAAGLSVSGCISSPTYGTGTPADQQLLEDVTSLGSIFPKQERNIELKPRPDLVVASADPTTLPKPQKDIASASNPDWPESPEQKRARLRAEATAQQNNPAFEPQIATDAGGGTAASPAFLEAQDRFSHSATASVDMQKQSAEFKRRMAENKQGSPTVRKYLSEPPLSYRQPAPTAPANQLGVDEAKKERERKAALRKKEGKSGWGLGNLFSWL